MIAFALALNTPVLLLDEPTNSLDIPSKMQFRKLIASVADSERCIVISTHQVRDLENLIDPIIILDHNRLLLNQPVEAITRQLVFDYTPDKPAGSLYCEQVLQGYASVSINKDGRESILNIESLFNAVICNKEAVKELFNA
jgi:ABC-2 type transport system ATP-binding protein